MGRRSWYVGVIGVVIGALVVGVVLPFVIGADPSATSTAAGNGTVDTPTGPDGTSTTNLGAGGAAPAAAAGGDGGAPTGSRSDQPGTAATGPTSPRSSDTAGSSATTAAGPIKVGFTILDIGAVGRAGIDVAISPEQQERAWRAYVKDVNDRNLIGRKIEPVFATYDVLNQDSQNAACLSLTEDHKVFAVIGGFNNAAPNFCVVQQHATPLISNMGSNPDSYYTQSAGRLITATGRSSRMFKTAVGVLDDAGALEGKKIGILRSDANDPTGEATGHLEQALRAAGHTVAHVSRLPAPPAADSQIPIEVNRMRQSGAEVVFLLAGSTSSTGFVQAADAQAYRPRYVATDWGAMFNATGHANMPANHDGTLVVTNAREAEWRVDRPEPALSKECTATYERVSGTKLAARGTNEHTLTGIYCDLIRMFVAAMRAGGAGVTKERFPAAMGRVGTLPFASWGDAIFSPGKTDGGDFVLLTRWRRDCRCLHPVGDFRRGKA